MVLLCFLMEILPILKLKCQQAYHMLFGAYPLDVDVNAAKAAAAADQWTWYYLTVGQVQLMHRMNGRPVEIQIDLWYSYGYACLF